MVTRRRGGPYDRPYRIYRRGLIWRVYGRAGRTFYNIQLLAQGRHRNLLLYRRNGLGRQLREQIVRYLHSSLLKLTPIRTSRLRSSTRIRRNPARVQQGPGRGQGRGRGTSGFYGRYANRFSRRSGGFIERSATQASLQAQPLLRRFQQYRQNIDRLDDIGHGRINPFRGIRGIR